MKPNRSYLHFASSFLTLFVACQSFGQAEVAPTILKIDASKIKIEKPLDLNNKLLIDFNKIDLTKTKVESIQAEIRQGPGSGGGGSSCALMLRQHTLEILEQIKYYRPFQQDDVGTMLEANIKVAKFYMGTDLHIDGKKVEAINYPLQKVIEIEQSFCDKLTTVTPASVGLLMHEYLGLSRFDDTTFQISGDFIKTVYKNSSINKVGFSGFSSVHINALRAAFQKGKSLFDVNKMARGTQCLYFSEKDERVISKEFRIKLLSEQSVAIEFIDPKTDQPDARGTIILNASTRMYGVIVELPSGNLTYSSFLILREGEDGNLVGEWAVASDTVKETLMLSRSLFPVAALGIRGTLAAGYSVCAPGK